MPDVQATRLVGRIRASTVAGTENKFVLFAVYGFLFMLLCNPHWWFLNRGPATISPAPILVQLRLPILAFVVVLVVLATNLHRMKPFPALTAYVAYQVLHLPFGFIRGEALAPFTVVLMTYVLALTILAVLQHPRHVRNVFFLMLVFQFLWYGIHGIKDGGPLWDPWVGNGDAFGSYMAMGFISSMFVAFAASDRRLRWLAGATSLLCVAGLVSSFARGAFLGAVVAFAFGWFRSGRKRLTYLGAGVAAGGIIMVAGSLIVGVVGTRGYVQSSFWQELATIADDLAAPSYTEDRRLMWRIAVKEYKDNPIFGVGVGSYGAYAAVNYAGDEILGERFGYNPGAIWGRELHSIYFEVLAEQGTVGVLLLLWMLVDFWRRNSWVRRMSPESDDSLTPGLRTRWLAVGLETSLVVVLVCGLVYNQMSTPLFYLLLTVNALLHYSAVKSKGNHSPGGRAEPRRVRGHRTSHFAQDHLQPTAPSRSMRR